MMGQNSKIEWCDHTFNPWVGCMKISEGCKNCYAERDFTRKSRWANTWGPAGVTERIRTSDSNWKKPLAWNKQAQAGGRRARVFCASLADVFEDNSQLEDWRIDLFMLIENTPWLDWLLLTKRPENVCWMIESAQAQMGAIVGAWGWFKRMTNVWIGTSVENQEQADRRIPKLLKVPAAIRFLSCEPLLGPVVLPSWDSYVLPNDFENNGPMTTSLGYSYEPDNLIDWVIVGGESGPKARPMHPNWARSLRNQCQAAGVKFFFKQWGELLPIGQEDSYDSGWTNKEYPIVDAHNLTFYRVGKHAAGRLLDGREWNEFPVVAEPG